MRMSLSTFLPPRTRTAADHRYRITVTIIISFLARGLSSIRSQIFCYTAISSAGIVGILPGYLIRKSPETVWHGDHYSLLCYSK